MAAIPKKDLSQNEMVIDWLYAECKHANGCDVKIEGGNIVFPELCDTSCRARILKQYINMFGDK